MTSFTNESSIDSGAEIPKADVDIGLFQEVFKYNLLHLSLFFLLGTRKIMFENRENDIEPVARQLGLCDLVSKLLVFHLALIALSVILFSAD